MEAGDAPVADAPIAVADNPTLAVDGAISIERPISQANLAPNEENEALNALDV